MIVWLYPAAAVCAYLVGGLNPAILLSKAIYHQDIRTCGSKNPGFTNFKRCFGNRWAWLVMAVDLSKAAVVIAVFAHLFDVYLDDRALGAAVTGCFCLLGHAFPVWYHFDGGKGFLVTMSLLWVIDWRAGLVATIVLCVLLPATKYMSLATMCALCSGWLFLLLSGMELLPLLLCAAQVGFVIVRHKENIKRLVHGTEARFSFHTKTQNS